MLPRCAVLQPLLLYLAGVLAVARVDRRVVAGSTVAGVLAAAALRQEGRQSGGIHVLGAQ